MLTLYEPKYEDLWFRQMMLADEDTMSYNHAWGGTIPWPEDKWSGWYDYWIACHEGKRYYFYAFGFSRLSTKYETTKPPAMRVVSKKCYTK